MNFLLTCEQTDYIINCIDDNDLGLTWYTLEFPIPRDLKPVKSTVQFQYSIWDLIFSSKDLKRKLESEIDMSVASFDKRDLEAIGFLPINEDCTIFELHFFVKNFEKFGKDKYKIQKVDKFPNDQKQKSRDRNW